MRKDDFIMKKKIFICSPYRGRVEENKKNAVSYARITAMSGDVPIVPHLYFPSFLDDNIPNERMTGIAMGLELMDMCDEVYVFGFDITEGMKFELDHAKETRKPVRLYDMDFNPVNVRTIPVDERADARQGHHHKSEGVEVGGPLCQQSMSVTDCIRVTVLWSLPERKRREQP